MKLHEKINKSKSAFAFENADLMSALPPEITSLILSFLSPKDLLTARVVSKVWKNRVDDNNIWKDRIKMLGGKPKNYRQQFFLLKTTLDTYVSQMLKVVCDYYKCETTYESGQGQTGPDALDLCERTFGFAGNIEIKSDDTLPSKIATSTLTDTNVDEFFFGQTAGFGDENNYVSDEEIVFSEDAGSLFAENNFFSNVEEDFFGQTGGLNDQNNYVSDEGIDFSEDAGSLSDESNFVSNTEEVFFGRIGSQNEENKITISDVKIDYFGLNFTKLLPEIIDIHFNARAANISTFALFTAILQKIEEIKPKDTWDYAYMTILLYLLYITNRPNILEVSNFSDKHKPMSACDYRDLISMIELYVSEKKLDLCQSISGDKYKNFLDLIIRYDNFNSFLRPSPTVIIMLINAGANFDFNVSCPLFNDLSFIDTLVLLETKFYYFNTISVKHSSTVIVNDYIKEYGEVIGKELLINNKAYPLSAEFLVMAKTILRNGGQFSSPRELIPKIMNSGFLYSLMRFHDLESDKYIQLIDAAFSQLEKLKKTTELQL